MASAVDSRLAYARLSAVAMASRLPTANRGSTNSYTTSWDTTPARRRRSGVSSYFPGKVRIWRVWPEMWLSHRGCSVLSGSTDVWLLCAPLLRNPGTTRRPRSHRWSAPKLSPGNSPKWRSTRTFSGGGTPFTRNRSIDLWAPLRIRDLTEDDWLNGLWPSAAMLAPEFPGVSRAPIELSPLQDRAQVISYSEYCHTAAARRSSWTRRRML